MIFKRFRFNIISRVLFLCVFIYLFFFLLLKTHLFVTTFIVGILVIYQVYNLFRYVEKTNQDLSRFFRAIKYSDFSQSFVVSGLGSYFDELKAAFSEVIKEFQKARAEKEEQYRYLQIVVQHVGIGLIGFQPNGEVELINTAAKRLMKITQLKNIKSLSSLSPSLVDRLLRLRSGQKALLKVQDNDELLQLVIYATEFKLRGKAITLVSIQNIQSELEEKEMEAWQKLIRVLTHEIMNSVTPIASLASTVNDLLTNSTGIQKLSKEINDETIKDISSGVQTIQKRSEGLLHFVDAYRKLTRLPKPDFQIFPITELFQRVHQLLSTQITKKTVDFCVNIEPASLELTADPKLIEQVLINLLLNAIQALDNQQNARIILSSLIDERGRILIQVIDNGPGIPEEALEKIFIPFFTTKEDGSGIGLSLSRQIMRLHRGTISAHSKPNIDTVFTLRF